MISMARGLYLYYWIILLLVGSFGLTQPVLSVQPGEQLTDPKLEQRARELSKNIRCLVCQNQSIDDSDAPLAKDLRVLLRERLVAGDNDDEIFDFLVSRYGSYVLLKPPVNSSTYILWFAPILFFIAAFAIYFLWRRAEGNRLKPHNQAEISDDEVLAYLKKESDH